MKLQTFERSIYRSLAGSFLLFLISFIIVPIILYNVKASDYHRGISLQTQDRLKEESKGSKIPLIISSIGGLIILVNNLKVDRKKEAPNKEIEILNYNTDISVDVRLRSLKELLEKQIITFEEFEKKKTDILDSEF